MSEPQQPFCPTCREHPTSEKPCSCDLNRWCLGEAKKSFLAVLEKQEGHNGLVLLEKEGWREQEPHENFWVFLHHLYPGVEVYWNPGTGYFDARNW